ncbi:glycosyltransferase family 2 protein [Vibrio nitrifigilis]|uniref:Glycosyltransferase family 2 protein n=1 Tax=Vibrio nitrifigilis TaxID=2789781 RepID=A0ABS0GFM2_9VIBR|nr:glycosyltransferase family 2 protein [Vibrio nitrifigilis]MBF9001204.1 glycosyltransferase family 2 protein [Vibrio nitrifigilis]
MKLSIIVCGYNVEKYIDKTLQSLFEIKINDVEIIVINDGSNDGTEQILDQYKTHFPTPKNFSLEIVNFENNTQGGVATAANYGLNMAKGDLIAFIDGDDWIAPDAFTRAVNRLANSDADFIFSENIDFWMSTGEYLPHPDHEQIQSLEEHKPYEELKKDLLKVAAMPWRKIYRKEFLDIHNIRFPEGDYFFEDNPFHWMVVTKSERCLINKEATHYYRMGNPNQTVIGKGEKFLKMFEHFLTIEGFLEENNLSSSYEIELLQWFINHVLYVSERTHIYNQYRFYCLIRPLLSRWGEEEIYSILEKNKHNKYVFMLFSYIISDNFEKYLELCNE